MLEFRDVAVTMARHFDDRSLTELLDACDTVMNLMSNYQRHQLTHEQLVNIAKDNNSIMFELDRGRKIQAIKRLRDLTTCGLKEAKDAVEDQQVQMKIYPNTNYNTKE